MIHLQYQVFKVPDSGFVEYMKIEFLTHYGHEYYCPLSLVRVHGMSMMEYYTTVESQGDDPIVEDEHLWPAEVREQLIQPQYDVTNTSESFPIKNDVDEEDLKPLIPPINNDIVIDSPVTPALEIDEILNGTTLVDAIKEIIVNGYDILEPNPTEDSHSTLISTPDTVTDQKHPPLTPPSSYSSQKTVLSPDNDLSNTPIIIKDKTSEVDTAQTDPSIKLDSTISSQFNDTSATDNMVSFTESAHATTVSSTNMASEEGRSSHPSHPKITSNNYAKEGSTQESIYKTIMKRLNVLEGNMTLSLRYLDEQNKNLNGVLKDMEKKHQDQLIQLIGHLNETASYRIDSMVKHVYKNTNLFFFANLLYIETPL